METRGVDSVPSPVATLQSSSPTATHEAFVDAVAESFATVFGVNRTTPEKVAEEDVLDSRNDPSEYLRRGMAELNVSLYFHLMVFAKC